MSINRGIGRKHVSIVELYHVVNIISLFKLYIMLKLLLMLLYSTYFVSKYHVGVVAVGGGGWFDNMGEERVSGVVWLILFSGYSGCSEAQWVIHCLILCGSGG